MATIGHILLSLLLGLVAGSVAFALVYWAAQRDPDPTTGGAYAMFAAMVFVFVGFVTVLGYWAVREMRR